MALVGIHGRANGRNEPADFEVFARSKAEAVLLLSSAAPEEATRLIADGRFVLVRLYIDMKGRKVSAEEFAKQGLEEVAQFRKAGVTSYQLHNEPNLIDEGLGSSWNNGFEFSDWFIKVYSILKARFPDVLFGFPGVSPGETIAGIRQDSNTFLAQASKAISLADWIGVHYYWLGKNHSPKDVLEYTKYKKDLYLTEFANVDKAVGDVERGRQYVEYYKSIRFIPRLKAAFAFCVSATNPDFDVSSWRDETGKLNTMSDIVGARMPDTKLHKLGIHSLGNGQVIPLVKRAKELGVYFPVVKVIANGGVCIDVKKLEPRTKTILRFVNQDEDSAQGVEHWSSLEMIQHAARSVSFAYDRLNGEEKAAVNYFEVGNEADINNPDGSQFYPFGWHQFGLYLIEIVKQANIRGIKVALPGFNAGSPEYTEFQALASTGLFALMRDGGHILTVHDGNVTDRRPPNVIASTFQSPIPNAPLVSGAGSIWFRYRYYYQILKDRGEVVPCVISEMYLGGTIQEPIETQIARIQWYDEQASRDSYVLAFCPFTIDSNGREWKDQDYTPIYSSLVELMENKTVSNQNTHFSTASLLNIRQFPWLGTIEPPKVRQIIKGTQVKSEGVLNGWMLISPSGNEWVSQKFLSPL